MNRTSVEDDHEIIFIRGLYSHFADAAPAQCDYSSRINII